MCVQILPIIEKSVRVERSIIEVFDGKMKVERIFTI